MRLLRQISAGQIAWILEAAEGPIFEFFEKLLNTYLLLLFLNLWDSQSL